MVPGETPFYGVVRTNPGAYCGTGKGVFLYPYYTTMDAILHIEKNINFLAFSIYFSKKTGFMEKLYKKKKKI